MTGAPNEPRGTISAALAHGARLLVSKPALAEAQAREILSVVPDQAEALCLLGGALRAQGDAAGAITVLSPAAKQNPKSAALNFELGLAHAEAGAADAATEALRATVRFDPRHPHAWRVLGDQLTQRGDAAAAADAYARHIAASTNNPQLLEAAAALCENKLAIAERLLREFLKAHPTDVAAIRMLAEIGTRLGRLDDAERLLARCLELAPSFAEARYHYALVLHRQNKPTQALEQLQALLAEDPRNPNYRALKAAAFGRIGQYDEAIACYLSLLADFPTQPKAWMSYGHALKTVGRANDAIAAYRKSVAQMPHLGEAYWSLANLKTFRFVSEDIAAMQSQLDRADLAEEDRIHLHFALGKALEDAREYKSSFAQYACGNDLRNRTLRYSADDITRLVGRSKGLFTTEFFEQRRAFGSLATDPIFVVGLTRSGSTLIEQILSSHSMVEGTMELPDILTLTKRFGQRRGEGEQLYPMGLEALSAEDCVQLGEEYLLRTRVHRKEPKPYFIDKLPNNWSNIGFIHLIVPNARIIDARRHPLACCFSNFKQLFARGQGFSYDLADCGRYYRDYVELMAHFERVLSGRVYRILYEELVREPEREIRRLLEYCGLPFEVACLRFYENDRAVRTASSEQVRQPIYAEGLHQWQNFEPWLGPLKAALGATLEAYPNDP
jgi:predicted Zn-dependent protease